MILEGIITTIATDGTIHIAPMGPLIDDRFGADSITTFQLRPFQTSSTFRNLHTSGCGVLHVTDDVLLMARAAVGKVEPLPATMPAQAIPGAILVDCCRWYAFRAERYDVSAPRAQINCQVVDRGRVRDFWGFNRAKHAVIEGAILATRLHLLDPAEVQLQFRQLEIIVNKTAGEAERRAFQILQDHVASVLQNLTQD